MLIIKEFPKLPRIHRPRLATIRHLDASSDVSDAKWITINRPTSKLRSLEPLYAVVKEKYGKHHKQ